MALSQDVQDAITECLKHAEDGGQLVQASSRLMETLAKNGLSRVVRLKPDEIGVHSQNRDGFGLCPKDAHTLLSMIASVGFDGSQTHPVCTELQPGDTMVDFNRKLVESSGGLLPAINETMMRYASLSCSHTNAALRCALHEVASEEELVSLNGRISMSKIQSVDKALFDACHAGLEWTVIHRDVMSFSPQIAQLVQGACNVSSHIAKGESEWQILARMRSLMRTQPHAEWNQVKKQVLQTKPQCHEATPYMFTFLKNFSHEGLMEGIDTRIKGHTSTNKSLGKDFFVQLSAQSKDWKQQFLHLRHAVLSLAYTAEKSLNALDVKKLLGKELGQRSTKAQDLMVKLRALLDKEKLGDSSSAIQDLFHQFQDHVILECLDKMKDETPESLACSLVDEIEKHLKKRITAEFDGQNTANSRLQAVVSASSSGHSVQFGFIDSSWIYLITLFLILHLDFQRLIHATFPFSFFKFVFLQLPRQLEYDEAGNLKNPCQLVNQMGFQVGANVIRGNCRATITSMQGSLVQLSVDEGDFCTSYEIKIESFLKGEWWVTKQKADIQKYSWDNFHQFRPCSSDNINFMCVKGEVSRRMIELEMQHEASYKGLVLQTKPYKSVFTAKQYAKGKLILVPSTSRIERKACPGSVALGSIRDIGLYSWPCHGPPKRDGDLDGSFLCPFWMVKRTNKESEANVEVRKVIAEDQENNSVKIPLMYNILGCIH